MAVTHETLGENVVPSHYELKVSPDLKTFVFEGTESITVRIKRPTNKIILNSSRLKIKRATIVTSGQEQKASISKERDEEVTFSFRKKVSGEAQLWLSFVGRATDELEGLYRSRYAYNGKKGYVLSTQFEPVSARRAFPCFDEPGLKATFSLSLVVDKALECISNMPIASQKDAEKGKKLVMFAKSPVMSTYLLYIGVGRYSHINGKYRNVRLRVVATPGKEKLMPIALDYTKRYLAHHERYYGIRYPLPKLDMIAIPDFPVGAMENWGAISYRETALLGDKNTPIAGRHRIAEVIGHELAHQWFGDLVTMRWWNDLWLNESFANFMEKKSTDTLFPEWRVNELELADSKNTAFAIDQSKYTHPISVEVKTPAQISAIFDRISYEKGGRLLDMIEDYVVRDAFRKGLNAYLKKHAYSNASKDDLWDAIAGASRGSLNVKKVANYWTDATGYPIVKVEARRGRALLTQERYCISEVTDRSVWPIPITYRLAGSKSEKRMLMSGKRASVGTGNARWILLNSGQSGLYRVEYPNALLKHLGAAIAAGEINSTDAWGVQNDVFSLARTSRTKASRYLNFIDLYCSEVGYPANVELISGLTWIYLMLGEKKGARAGMLLKTAGRRLIAEVGWEKKKGEDALSTRLRNAAMSSLGIAGDREAIARSRELFHKLASGAVIDQDIRSAVYANVARSGDASDFASIRAMYEKEQLPQEKMRLLGALAGFKDRRCFEQGLQYCLTDNVRIQDKILFAGAAGSNLDNADLVWKWTKKNWKIFMRMYGPSVSLLYRFVTGLRIVRDEALLDDIKAFFAKKENMREDIKRELDQTLEAIESNIRFIKHNSHN